MAQGTSISKEGKTLGGKWDYQGEVNLTVFGTIRCTYYICSPSEELTVFFVVVVFKQCDKSSNAHILF